MRDCSSVGLFRTVFLVVLVFRSVSGLNSAYGFICSNGYCSRSLITNESEALSLGECHLSCNEFASLWPKPTGRFSKGNVLQSINPQKITLLYTRSTPVGNLLQSAERVFRGDIKDIIGENPTPNTGASLTINVNVRNQNLIKIDLETDESYDLATNKTSAGEIQVFIESSTYFGARHGLQTLTQLIIYDDLRDQLKTIHSVIISDGPAYPYRGVLIDSARNYLTPDSIKKTLRGMALSKLNSLHWHLTDTQSFPYVSESHPELSKFGVYTPNKVYRTKDIKEIVEYATVRGIRVVPEFDTPAHVGAGWENTNLTTCYNWQPFQTYCLEPPCGQVDPTKDELYDVLEDLFGDLLSDFDPDILHFGGDEVNFVCWNETENIVEWMRNRSLDTTEADFIKVVQYYQAKTLERVYKKAKREIQLIVWQSQVTRPALINTSYNSSNVIVQIWAPGNFSQNTEIIEQGFRVVLSNYDGLYLDCGLGSWNTDDQNNWCSPYKSWQAIYNNTPESIVGNLTNLVVGQEVAIWSEQTDSSALDMRIWPRAAAMAEIVWSEPATSYKAAESRFLVHRQRLVQTGINAEAVMPEWCRHKEETCRLDSFYNTQGVNSNTTST